jgi:hypothetical protein
VATLRGFELDRLTRVEHSFKEFRRRLEALLRALVSAQRRRCAG